MKKLLILSFIYSVLSLNIAAQTKTWNGSADNNWFTDSNWTPTGAPTGTDDVVIDILTNPPIIGSGAAAARTIFINADGAELTVNSGASLMVSTNSGFALQVFRGTFHNNGTTSLINTNASFINNNGGIYATNNSVINNGGNITVNGGVNIAILLTPGTFNNLTNASATVSGRDIVRAGSSNSAFTNSQGATFIGVGTNAGLWMNPCVLTNSGIMDIDGQVELYTASSPFTNNNCGIFKVSANFFVQTGVTATNNGLLEIQGNLINNSTFTNNGVVVANAYPIYTNNRVQINNNAGNNGIFTISNTAGETTINGIFTDETALNSAGSYTQGTNVFVPSNTLTPGIQTLYAQITLSGSSSSCPYTVPFNYEYILPPVFTMQPSDVGACVSTPTSFSVIVEDATTYQWQLSTNGGVGWSNLSNGTSYSNVTTTTLNVNNVILSYADYQYRCVATGPGGVTNSDPAVIIINPPTLPSSSGTITWMGTVNTNWNSPCNWSPSSVPTAENDVIINNVSNDPIIGSGTIASTAYLTLNTQSVLVVNSGGVLNVRGRSNEEDGMIMNRATFTNHGTTEIQLADGSPLSVSGIFISTVGTTTINNHGTLSIKATSYPISNSATSFTINNTSTGILNLTSGNMGDGFFDPSTRIVLDNAGIINSNCANNNGFQNMTNSGTFNINGNFRIRNTENVTNEACGKFLIDGNYDNFGFTSNAGYIYISGQLFRSGGSFNNNGVIKYNSLSGSNITSNNAASVIVRNIDLPIFLYSLGGYNGTIDGIFTDTTATISAGSFTAPNTFVPLETLPSGSQTLYAKIIPSGGACFYIVPFTYVVIPSAPSFTMQPDNLNVCSAVATFFSVTTVNASSFQWQISTNNGDTWTDLEASSIYTNVSSATLNISNSSGLSGNQYRCVATGEGGVTNSNPATLNIVPQCTVTSIATGAWESPNTWDIGRAPIAGDDVIIETGHIVTLSGLASIRNLTQKGTLILTAVNNVISGSKK
jgi:trimeric autotransporter adhesin